VLNRHQLARDVQECYGRFQLAAGFRHVRRLIVDGQMQKDDGHELDSQYQRHQPKLSAAERRDNKDGILDRYLGHVDYLDIVPDEILAEDVYEINDAWRPLADLIKQLPALADLIYRCYNQFPPCLLQTLHQHRPRCKLHIDLFKLRCLNAPVTDAHELTLAMSPCLHSVRVRYDELDDMEGIPNYHAEATMRLVAGMAPNLKEVHMLHDVGAWPPWKGFTLDKERHRFSPGSLRFLQLESYSSIMKELVEDWRAHTDFSVLRVLKLQNVLEEDALNFLAMNCRFPSLVTLALRLCNRDLQRQPTINYDDITSRFLRSLPHLSTIELVGQVSNVIFDSVLDHHGSSLRKLWVLPLTYQSLTQRDIRRIRDHCPLLEDLRLTIRRSRGDATEVATYKALGSLPKLRHLSLGLDATGYDVLSDAFVVIPDDPSFDEFDQQYFKVLGGHNYRNPRNGHLQDAFINSALDETLARAIFRTISLGKRDGSLPLERLKVRVNGGWALGQTSRTPDLERIICNLSRSWLVEPKPRDDCRHELVVRELGRQERQTKEARSPQTMPTAYEPIFRRIWPAKQEGGSDWRDDWHSLPLSASDT
jgi:hypothetical protein